MTRTVTLTLPTSGGGPWHLRCDDCGNAKLPVEVTSGCANCSAVRAEFETRPPEQQARLLELLGFEVRA